MVCLACLCYDLDVVQHLMYYFGLDGDGDISLVSNTDKTILQGNSGDIGEFNIIVKDNLERNLGELLPSGVSKGHEFKI